MSADGSWLVAVLLIVLVALCAAVLAPRLAALAGVAGVAGLAARQSRVHFREPLVVGGDSAGAAAPASAPAESPAESASTSDSDSECLAETERPELPGAANLSETAAVCGGHAIGLALHAHARSLPVATDGFLGGRVGHKKGADAPSAKHWTKFATWDELWADPDAFEDYTNDCALVRFRPNLNWDPVLAAARPWLLESREYVGLVNFAPDRRSLVVVAAEPAPAESTDVDTSIWAASVPAALVRKYDRPALFMFHTHPADPRHVALPSTYDLAAAIHFAAARRFAASVVISRYGAFVYGLGLSALEAISEASDSELATLNLAHDVVAAHEAVRSWERFSLQEYFAFYPRHRLFLWVFPTPDLVGDMYATTYCSNLLAPVDHALIAEQAGDVAAHHKRRARAELAKAKLLGVKGPAPKGMYGRLN